MLEVLYEDNHLIAVNKSSGDIVQGDITGDVTLSDKVKLYIKKKYRKPGNVFIGLIHRLDRPTSGVMLFARTSKCLSRMNEQFRDKKVQKTYWAIVRNIPNKKTDTLKNYLIKNQKKNKSYISKEGKLSILKYNLVRRLHNYYHLEIFPKTGRHHQIRVQLAHIGCPIKGDLKYGSKRSNKDGGIDLHAYKIEFIHPVTKKSVSITAPPPNKEIWR